MQRLLEIPQEVYDFLRNFRLRAGDLNREGGSKTAPFTHPLPGVHAPLAGISILQQTLRLFICRGCSLVFRRQIFPFQHHRRDVSFEKDLRLSGDLPAELP